MRHSSDLPLRSPAAQRTASRNFDSLPSAIRHEPEGLVFYAFDLLHLDGQDWRQRELLERRAMLSENHQARLRYSLLPTVSLNELELHPPLPCGTCRTARQLACGPLFAS